MTGSCELGDSVLGLGQLIRAWTAPGDPRQLGAGLGAHGRAALSSKIATACSSASRAARFWCARRRVTPSAAPQVTIDNFTFGPKEITVSPGTTVTWLNRDDIPHTVTDAAETKTFASAPLDTDDSYSHLFATPGTYHYFCALHPHMQGTIVVR